MIQLVSITCPLFNTQDLDNPFSDYALRAYKVQYKTLSNFLHLPRPFQQSVERGFISLSLSLSLSLSTKLPASSLSQNSVLHFISYSIICCTSLFTIQKNKKYISYIVRPLVYLFLFLHRLHCNLQLLQSLIYCNTQSPLPLLYMGDYNFLFMLPPDMIYFN